MKIPESLRKTLSIAIVGVIVSGYGFVFREIYHQAPAPFQEHLLPATINEMRRGSIQLLLLSLVVSVAWIGYLLSILSTNPHLIRSRYRFDQKTKIRFRRGIRYCNICLLSPECLPSPLAMTGTQGMWICGNKNCGHPYYDETFVQPPEEPPEKNLAMKW